MPETPEAGDDQRIPASCSPLLKWRRRVLLLDSRCGSMAATNESIGYVLALYPYRRIS